MFAPPEPPIECHCVQCHRVFMSSLIIRYTLDNDVHWMCPVPGCGGRGYTLDIFPTDSGHPDAAFAPGADDWDDETDDDETDGEWIAQEMKECEGGFDPPVDWTPESDHPSETAPAWDGNTDPRNTYDEPLDTGRSGQVTHPSRYFTQEDYDEAAHAGVYEAEIARRRREWLAIQKLNHRQTPQNQQDQDVSVDIDADDDIPF